MMEVVTKAIDGIRRLVSVTLMLSTVDCFSLQYVFSAMPLPTMYHLDLRVYKLRGWNVC